MDPRVIPAVQAVTSDPRYQATMFYACGAESGCMAIVQQGGGPGRGPWQMETTWEDPARAMNPITAAVDFFNRWPVKQCADQQGDLWQSNPVKAAYQAARCAESNMSGQGAAYGPSQQQAGQDAMKEGLAAMANPIGTNRGKRCTFGWALPDGSCILPGAPGEGPSNPLDSTLSFLSGVTAIFGSHQFWIRALLVVGGLIAILIGIEGLTHFEQAGAAVAAAAA